MDDAGDRNYKTVDEKTGIMQQIDSNAELIVMLSAIEADLAETLERQ